jgi:hypothetical protein
VHPTTLHRPSPSVCAPKCAQATSTEPVPTYGSITMCPLATLAMLAITSDSSASMLVGPMYSRRLRAYLQREGDKGVSRARLREAGMQCMAEGVAAAGQGGACPRGA